MTEAPISAAYLMALAVTFPAPLLDSKPEKIWQLMIFTPSLFPLPPHTGYAAVVVIDGRDGAGAVGAMAHISVNSAVPDLEIGPGDVFSGYEVKAVNVVNIAVAVIVNAVSWDFLGVYPHIVLEVGMAVFHAFIHYGHNNFGVSAGEAAPDVLDVDIGPFYDVVGISRTALVHIVPLVREHRVVELGRCCLGGRDFVYGINFPFVGLFGNAVVFHGGHFGKGSHLPEGFMNVLPFLKGYLIPAVQAELPLQIFLSGKRLEEGLYAPESGIGGELLLAGNLVEFHQEGVGGVVVSQLDYFGFRRRGFLFRKVFPLAGRQANE